MIRVEGARSSHKNNPQSSKIEREEEFVSPFLKDDNKNDIVTVYQKEPSKKSKVYVIRDEAGLTGRNYVYCSGCQHRAFKQFRNVYRAVAPDHLKQYGTSDNELLKFCRKCWFYSACPIVEKQDHTETQLAPSPYFERSSLGITDKRACFGWHFIQRDFARQRFEEFENAVDKNSNKKAAKNDHDVDALLPLATVVVQNGSDFITKCDSGNVFDCNGRESTLSTNEISDKEIEITKISPPTFLESQKEINSERKLFEIIKQIRRDHDYAPTIQKEVEVTTSRLGLHRKPVVNEPNMKQKVANALSQINHKKDFKTSNFKIDRNGQQVKNLAKNFLRKAVEMGNNSPQNLGVRMNMPVEKVEEELKTRREKGEAIDPTHLVGLKATSESGQTLPGLICPLCGKHTVKSYSVWRRDNAPEKISGLFKDGITVIRACRKCVPYPINREKEKLKPSKYTARKSKLKNNASASARRPCNSKQGLNDANVPLQNKNKAKEMKEITDRKRPADKKNDRTFQVKVERLDGCNGLSVSKGQIVPVKGDLMKVKGDNIQVRVQVVKETNRSDDGQVVNGIEDTAAIKAKLEEEKRKLRIASGQDLTGLECFEMLPSEENIAKVSNTRKRECKLVASSVSLPLRGRPPKTCPSCAKCQSPLDKSYKTVTMAKCPKRLLNLFSTDPPTKILKLCKKCLK